MKIHLLKRSFSVLWIGVFLAIAIASLRAQIPVEGGELLVNPGFESCPSTATPITATNAEQYGFGASHTPGLSAVRWSLNSFYPTVLTVVTDEKVAHTGKVCVKIGYQAPEATEKVNNGGEAALCAGRFSVNPGEKYVFKFWARRDGAASPATIYVYQYGDGNFLGSAIPGQPVVNGNWQEYVMSYEVTNSKTKFVFFAIHTPKGADLYLDDASLKKTGLAGLAAIPVPTAVPTPAVIPVGDQTHWSEVSTLVSEGKITLEGQGWTNVESFYDRLPSKANGVVTPDVWGLGHDSAGLSLRFETDATELQVRWKLTSDALAMPHMPITGVSSVDLYVKAADGRWLFQPRKFEAGIGATSTFLLDGGRKACELYLPLYNGVKSIEFGVAEGQAFSKIQDQRPRPIVVYGTSIAQGGCASRPGLAWTSIMGRHLNVPVINLGFSGSGKMEMDMANLLAELDPSVYVLDCLPNMSPALVSERMEPFVRKLRSVRPKTPIVLVEDAHFQNIFPTLRGKTLRPIYEKLKGEGDGNLYFVSGEGVLGEDGEGTVDGLHPNDLGMMRQAQAMEKALRPILKETPQLTPAGLPVPTLSDVAYGSHPKQVLHFWQARSDTPTPLLFYIHGGGWDSGDRMRVAPLLKPMLDAGISVVSVEYRFVDEATRDGVNPPVKGSMYDAARALQFVRSQAAEWNIDKSRIAASGESAGGCSSLWLAFHDDLADPKSSDPVARESSRLFCAAVSIPQTTLDPQQMREWTPNSHYGGHAFGFSGNNAFAAFLAKRDELLPLINEYSPYALVTSDDPPVYLYYGAPPALGQTQKDPTHTTNFGVKLQEKCQSVGVACELVYPGAADIQHPTVQDYLIKKLKASKNP